MTRASWASSSSSAMVAWPSPTTCAQSSATLPGISSTDRRQSYRRATRPSGALDHFYWAFTEELATRAGMTRASFEDEHDALRQAACRLPLLRADTRDAARSAPWVVRSEA